MNSRNIETKLASGFIKELLEERLPAMGMLRPDEEIIIESPISIRIVSKEPEEVTKFIDHNEESIKELR